MLDGRPSGIQGRSPSLISATMTVEVTGAALDGLVVVGMLSIPGPARLIYGQVTAAGNAPLVT